MNFWNKRRSEDSEARKTTPMAPNDQQSLIEKSTPPQARQTARFELPIPAAARSDLVNEDRPTTPLLDPGSTGQEPFLPEPPEELATERVMVVRTDAQKMLKIKTEAPQPPPKKKSTDIFG